MTDEVRLSYWAFIVREAAHVNSDGCSCVSEWHEYCCFEHDLACHYGKNPRSAYAHYCNDETCDFWGRADSMGRRKADYMFGDCNYQWSPNKVGKVRSFFRFLGVRVGALVGVGRQPKDLNVQSQQKTEVPVRSGAV
jgi:hypothetical protein